jgi:transitional endoplasmic reticulum ATPase
MSSKQKKPILKNGKFNSAAFDADVKERLKEIIDKKPLKNIAQFIETEIENSTQLTSFNYGFICFPEDGAYALHRSIQELEGYSVHKESGPSNDPPETIDVQFADGSRIKVPWGSIALPGLGKDATISMTYDSSSRKFGVSGQCERRYVSLMDDIMEKTKHLLATDSIYRGKAIRLDGNLRPQFLDLSKVDKIPMYLSKATEFSLQPIISRIEQSEQCIANGLDLKFGALMEGEYGTGKTLLAFKLANKAIQNDWGFIYLTDPTKVTEMLDIAGQLCGNGRGVLTFVEDIDQVLRGARNTKMNEILNILDGGDTKGRNIISVFTTNHLELIDPTFLRGKRIGSLISMTALDQPTAMKFISSYLGDSVTDDVTEAANKVAEMEIVPAFLAEILDRVKANMVYTSTTTTSCEDIVASIDSYTAQMSLAKTKSQEETDEQAFVGLFKKLCVDEAFTETLEKLDLV